MKDIYWFKNIFAENGFVLDDYKLTKLAEYCELLIEKNSKVNLISSKSENNMWEEHILHSLSFLLKVKIKEDSKILDLGSGGGLPGIPLKIVYPDLDVTLLDSTQKKILADKEMISSLGLEGIKAIAGRAEELKTLPELKEKFDYVVCRAVAPLDKLFEWSIPFLKKETIYSSGHLPTCSVLAIKGGDIDEEIKRVKRNKLFGKMEIADILFSGVEELLNPDKKLVVMFLKKS